MNVTIYFADPARVEQRGDRYEVRLAGLRLEAVSQRIILATLAGIPEGVEREIRGSLYNPGQSPHVFNVQSGFPHAIKQDVSSWCISEHDRQAIMGFVATHREELLGSASGIIFPERADDPQEEPVSGSHLPAVTPRPMPRLLPDPPLEGQTELPMIVEHSKHAENTSRPLVVERSKRAKQPDRPLLDTFKAIFISGASSDAAVMLLTEAIYRGETMTDAELVEFADAADTHSQMNSASVRALIAQAMRHASIFRTAERGDEKNGGET